MVYKFLDKKTWSGVSVNKQLAEEFHKPVIKTFKRRKVYATFKDNIWAAGLTKVKSLSSKNKNVKHLLCVIDVFTKYAWVEPLKDEKSKTVLNAFVEKVSESRRKSNELWVDQWSEFYNKHIQKWLGNSVIAKRFKKTLRDKIYKKITTNDSKPYLTYLNKLVDQYNNKNLINADYSVFTEKYEANHKAPKFKVNDRVLELLNMAIFLVNITLEIGKR